MKVILKKIIPTIKNVYIKRITCWVSTRLIPIAVHERKKNHIKSNTFMVLTVDPKFII